MRRKQVSKRRWKARCAVGREIPQEAIVIHSLHRWFKFEAVDDYTWFYKAV